MDTDIKRLFGKAREKKRSEVQNTAIKQIRAVWKSGERSAVMRRPTGFGKTYTVAKLMNLQHKNGQKY